ncbi:hypothetical protein ABPG74_004181 [Tetrahymena malaccensis]
MQEIIGIFNKFKNDQGNILSILKQEVSQYQSMLINQKSKIKKGIFFTNKQQIANETTILIAENLSKGQIKNSLLDSKKIIIDSLQLVLDKLSQLQKNVSINLNDLPKLIEQLQSDIGECFSSYMNDFEDQQIISQCFLINEKANFEQNIQQIIDKDYSKEIAENFQKVINQITKKIGDLKKNIKEKSDPYFEKVENHFNLKIDYLEKKQINQNKEISNNFQNRIQNLNLLQQQSELPQINFNDIQMIDENYIELANIEKNKIQINFNEFQQNNNNMRQSCYMSTQSQNADRFGRRSTIVWNNNENNQKEIIIWIDQEIFNQQNTLKMIELQKKFEWVEVKGFQSFEEFENYIQQKLQQQYHRNMNVNQKLKIKRAQTLTDLRQLDEFNGQEDLTKSFVSQQTVYQKLEQQTEKELYLQFIFIASGKVIKKKLDKLPCCLKSIIVYCNNTKFYYNLFKNKPNISVITKDFNQIIEKIQKTLVHKRHEKIYNYDIQKLNQFEEFELIQYMSNKTYCADKIESKSEQEIQQILQNIINCSQIQIKNVQKVAQLIHKSFTSEDEVIKLYTSNNFCSFIQELMSYLNEQILQTASYLITTIRYAIQIYDDGCKDLFNAKDFKLYRGISTNVEEFKNKFPIETTFVTFNFSSSSLKEEIAQQFAGNNKGDPLVFEITFEYKNKDFEKYRPKKIIKSNFNEEEFLFNCFSIFCVKNYRQEGRYTYVQLSLQDNALYD